VANPWQTRDLHVETREKIMGLGPPEAKKKVDFFS
jgi:hypothetical protein